MTISKPSIDIKPLAVPLESGVNFGAEVYNIDVENLSDADFELLKTALYQKQVLVLKNQEGLSPKAQFELTKRFDPGADNYGHGKTLDAKRSVLHPDLKTIPHQSQVQVIGNGFFDEYEGLQNITLKHPHHRKFHKHPIPEAEDADFTRFFRWHIDAALYDLDPPRVTSLMAVCVPQGRRQTLRYDDDTGDELDVSGRRQTLRYDDDTGDELDVSLGTTAFVSGENMYNILSDVDKEFVRTSKIEYAPHPYIWMTNARSLPDGLGLYSDSLELSDSDLPPIDPAKIKILPMCWKNPLTGAFALQIHPSAIRKIHLRSGVVIDDLAEVRRIVHRLQRPAIAPRFVYAHDWHEGDLVLFHNRGVLHSVVGAFGPGEKRLMRQCNMAGSEAVEGPDL